METIMAGMARPSNAFASPRDSRQSMPLTFLRAGEEARVLKVRGDDELHHHLENLGFVPGASLRIVSEHGGSLIIEVKGAQIALDKAVASKVIAR